MQGPRRPRERRLKEGRRLCLQVSKLRKREMASLNLFTLSSRSLVAPVQLPFCVAKESETTNGHE
jgi:hypothetical protein